MKRNDHLFSFIWSGLGFVCNKGGLLALMGIVSFYLPIENFAEFNIFVISLNVFAGVFGGALSLNGNRYGGESKNFYSIWLLNVSFSIFSALLFLIYNFYHTSYLNLDSAYKVLVVFGTCYITSINGLFYAQGNFKSYAFWNVIYGLGVLVLGSYGVKSYGNTGLFLGMALPGIMGFLISVFFVRSNFKGKLQLELVERSFKKVLGPNILSGLLFQPAVLIAATMIYKYSTPAGVVAYSLANQFRMIGGFFIVISGSVLMKQLVQNIDKREKEIERLNYSISYYPFLLIVLLLSSSSDFIMSYFNNVDPKEFKFNLLVLLLAALISAFKSAIARKFVTTENGKISILSNFSWFLIFFLLFVILIPHYGSRGASISFLSANLFQVLLWSKYYLKNGYFNMDFFDKYFYLSLFVLLVSLISISQDLYTIPIISTGIIVYINTVEFKKVNQIFKV